MLQELTHAPSSTESLSLQQMLMVDRPLPDVLHVLRRYFETAAIDWNRREAELKRSEAFLAQAQRLTKTGSVWWKPATGEITWSEGNYRLMEYPVGTTPTVGMAFDRCHPDDLQLVKDKLGVAIRDGATLDLEHRLMMPDGTVKHVHVIFQNVAAEGEDPEYLGASTDVTAWKEAEEKLRRSEEALGALRTELTHAARVASLGTLTASIAHELNQPLSGAVTNASTCLRLLASEPPNIEGARETARRMIRDGHRASAIIARLRDLFSRKAPSVEAVNLNDATREVLALMRSELQRAGATPLLELADDLPAARGDRVQLQQVIINLLRNAAEAGEGDRPRRIVITTAVDGADGVRLSMRDSGPGFAPENAQRFFDAFYTTKQNGMGIGLSVSRSIIESHRGQLWAVPNDDGIGATFSFTVPRAPDWNDGRACTAAMAREPIHEPCELAS